MCWLGSLTDTISDRFACPSVHACMLCAGRPEFEETVMQFWNLIYEMVGRCSATFMPGSLDTSSCAAPVSACLTCLLAATLLPNSPVHHSHPQPAIDGLYCAGLNVGAWQPLCAPLLPASHPPMFWACLRVETALITALLPHLPRPPPQIGRLSCSQYLLQMHAPSDSFYE